MFYNVKKSINTWLFGFYARKVTKLPRVVTCPDSKITIVTQLCSRDLIMYLVALKTFTNYVPIRKIVIVSDKLSDKDLAILGNQIENLTIINLDQVYDDRFPKGGCWERLLTILDLCRESYVIQLDADTITLKYPVEVLQCVDENNCFTLGTDIGQSIISFSEATKFVKNLNLSSDHVQTHAESVMEAVDLNNNLKYVRGCAGFAGFSNKALNVNQLADICGRIENGVGPDKWLKWGSEQVASNIVIANSVNSMVLPINKYHYYKPGREVDEFNFLHFIGAFRFENTDYAKLAFATIDYIDRRSK